MFSVRRQYGCCLSFGLVSPKRQILLTGFGGSKRTPNRTGREGVLSSKVVHIIAQQTYFTCRDILQKYYLYKTEGETSTQTKVAVTFRRDMSYNPQSLDQGHKSLDVVLFGHLEEQAVLIIVRRYCLRYLLG